MKHTTFCILVLAAAIPAATTRTAETVEPGLLFYLSGDNGFSADYACGNPEPAFLNDIEIISGGVRGSAIRVPDFTHAFSYFAPGNILAQRGTLSFFWRARTPYGPTPFHILQVPYCDHSSLDMIWLRLDYNGHGFDTFVTDVNLARCRVSYRAETLPSPDRWIHFAVAWDETRGIRFYIDGKLAGSAEANAVFDAGLDQIGFHGRLISPQYVPSAQYNHTRGGDFDELRIYDCMLGPESIARLADGGPAGTVPAAVRSMDDSVVRDEWYRRYGWSSPDYCPPPLAASSTAVRKVEIHDVHDLKQWVWKGTDGIPETTWPYVYNRSRLPGRTDYFIEPDWNCYSGSGKTVTFTMPDEPWNHIEIVGSAFGTGSLLAFDPETRENVELPLFDRPSGRERTVHRFEDESRGGVIRYTNDVQEMPIGEFEACYVTSGSAPAGTASLSYTLTARIQPDLPCLDELVDYINGRHPADERMIMVALPNGAPGNTRTAVAVTVLPVIHVLVPCDFRDKRPGWSTSNYSYTWHNIFGGLDGIEIELPALDVAPTHGELYPLNIQVRDPLWPNRRMLDFSFSVRPGEAKTLWLDTRDRILPEGRSLYLVIAGAGGDFTAERLEGARIRLVFKDYGAARAECEKDRFTQMVDNHGNIVECHPNVYKLRMFDRWYRDITDLLRINPFHEQARYYWSYQNGEQGWPPFIQPEAPEGVPLWAFRQVENMKLIRRFVMWWIDERQIENGQFGGGLSDDGDFSNYFPGPALMGIEPEKITDSILRLMEAYYDEGLFTNGLPTIQTDELHSYEEGIDVIPQTMLLDYGDPKVVERLMETAKAYDLITGINDLGERQIKTTYFSGTEIALEGVWGRTRTNYSHLVLHPGLALVEYNGHPAVKKMILEIVDGLLAHRRKDTDGHYSLPYEIEFPSGSERGGSTSPADIIHVFWAAWKWTGDDRYLLPLIDEIERGNLGILNALCANVIDLLDRRDSWGKRLADGRVSQHIAWQVTGDKGFLEDCYAAMLQLNTQRMSMMTEGHWWVDRVHISQEEIQRARLGGLALVRSKFYPGHASSWRFEAPATAESVALLIPDTTPRTMTIIAYNLENVPVSAEMTAWDIEPGTWEVVEGIDSDGDDRPDVGTHTRAVKLERTGSLPVTFPPRTTTVFRLRLTAKDTPYWERPDLGIGNDDVKRSENTLTVTVHSLGSVDAPAATIALVGRNGKRLAEAQTPVIRAPLDLIPKTAEVTIEMPSGMDLGEARVVIDPDRKLKEITRLNNETALR